LYISDKGKYQGQLNDQKRFMGKTDYEKKSKRLKKLIKELEECITSIESEIERLIDSDETLSKQHKLLCSIDGIGDRTAVKMIVETNAFKDFDNARKFSMPVWRPLSTIREAAYVREIACQTRLTKA